MASDGKDISQELHALSDKERWHSSRAPSVKPAPAMKIPRAHPRLESGKG